MKNIFENLPGMYACKWGLTDLYEEYENALREALDSNEDFDTGWFECKKEIRSARYMRCGDEFTISVSESMDDLWDGDDLIYDALWEACHSEEELPEYIIDSIKDAAIGGIDDCHESDITIPADTTTFDVVMEETSKLEDEVSKQNDDDFQILCEIVKAHYEYMKGEKNHEDQA